MGKVDGSGSGKLAVVLFNLGGPDSLEAVEPFLRNLFLDPAILSVPGPIRALLARRIARKRAPTTRAIYKNLGGKTPLLKLTNDQARALEQVLKTGAAGRKFSQIQCFTAMRYWHPRAREVVETVKTFGPETIVLLPLYPQFSTTTSLSSINEWKAEAVRQKLIVPTRAQCCWPHEEGFIAAHVRLLEEALEKVPQGETPRLLFSAHGLPVSIIEAGDPYQAQVEMTVAAVMKGLSQKVEHVICYQSRVTPQEWIGPSTEEELERAGGDGRAVVLTPIAFVSEHSETLVELDVEYAQLARQKGVETYLRVPALACQPDFIEALAKIVSTLALGEEDRAFTGPGGRRVCPDKFERCPCRQAVENKGALIDG